MNRTFEPSGDVRIESKIGLVGGIEKMGQRLLESRGIRGTHQR